MNKPVVTTISRVMRFPSITKPNPVEADALVTVGLRAFVKAVAEAVEEAIRERRPVETITTVPSKSAKSAKSAKPQKQAAEPLSRPVLWRQAVAHGLTEGLDYRKVSSAELINLISREVGIPALVQTVENELVARRDGEAPAKPAKAEKPAKPAKADKPASDQESRPVLWQQAVARGLTAGLDYRKVSREQLLALLAAKPVAPVPAAAAPVAAAPVPAPVSAAADDSDDSDDSEAPFIVVDGLTEGHPAHLMIAQILPKVRYIRSKASATDEAELAAVSREATQLWADCQADFMSFKGTDPQYDTIRDYLRANIKPVVAAAIARATRFGVSGE
jgi:hypothetical protein